MKQMDTTRISVLNFLSIIENQNMTAKLVYSMNV